MQQRAHERSSHRCPVQPRHPGSEHRASESLLPERLCLGIAA